MRAPELRLALDELVVDNFAGGGGASAGIEAALGRSVDIAINHDAEALAVHQANHPRTRHYVEDVWKVDPVEVCAGQRVGLLWLSPDCRHFSKAKGGKPVKKHIRGLAWVAVRWVKALRGRRLHPRVIILENVEEFQKWGPVLENGFPCPEREGRTFRFFVSQLRNLGYAVEWRELRACDFGAPTTRKRLFLIARCDGVPIRWPEPTHGPDLAPYRTAAECIDWQLPEPSIFERKRPLKANTLRRIAAGIERFVLNHPAPFIAPLRGTSASHTSTHSVRAPLSTISAQGFHHALVVPFIAGLAHGTHTVRPGTRTTGLDEPVRTIHAGGTNFALVAPRLTDLRAAFIAKHNGIGDKMVVGQTVNDPVHTITAKDQKAVVTALLSREACAKAERVRALLNAFQKGRAPQHLSFNLPRSTPASERFVLVPVGGTPMVLMDIGMRMLAPHELCRAQGFPPHYILDHTASGERLTRTTQVRLVGNSVSPAVAKALVEAQFPVQWPLARAA